MAYLSGTELTFLNGASTALNLTMPVHAANDVLVVFITADSNLAITMITTGWTAISTSVTAGSGVVSAAWYKKAASSSEVANITTLDAWCAAVYCIKDVDTTTQLDASSFTGVSTATSTPVSSSITTGTADCFLLYCIGIDGIAVATHSDPGVMFIHSFDDQGTTATTAACAAGAWYQQRATGATPAPTWTANLSNAYTRMTLAFRNKSGGAIPAYVDDLTMPGTTMIMGHHVSTLNNLTFDASVAISNIGPAGAGLTAVYDAPAETGDFGLNPYSIAIATTPSAQAVGTSAGFQVTFTTTHDCSTDFIVGTVIASTPKIANYTHGSTTQGGSFLTVADASNFFNSFQILANNSIPNTQGRAVFAVQPNQSTTRYGYSSSAASFSAVKKILFTSNCPTGAITLYVAEVHRARKHIVAGGSSTAPVDSAGMVQIGKSFRVPLIQPFGATGLLSYVPIQVGGGDAVNFQIDAGALEFPRLYNTTTKELNFHAAVNTIGISYAGKSGDVIKHTNSVIASASQYYWEINSAATSAATWDFTGLTIVGAAVTLRNVMTFDSMTFSSFVSLDATGCALTSCVLSKPPITNNSLTTNASTTFTTCNINTTTITAGNYLCSVASPAIFTSCTFIGSSSTGHAIRITTPGTYSVVGDIFTGYGADASTSAAIYNDSGGAVTLNISGGGSSPTVRNGTSATTSVVAGAVSVTLTATTVTGTAVQNANAIVKAAAGGPFPSDVTVTITNSGTTATVAHTSHNMATNDKVLIKGASLLANRGVFSITYINANSYSYTMGSSPGSNPTGTIKATFVVLSGLTNASGQLTMTRVFSSNQPITGLARKSTGSPLYKTAPITGTISSSTGASLSALLVVDE